MLSEEDGRPGSLRDLHTSRDRRVAELPRRRVPHLQSRQCRPGRAHHLRRRPHPGRGDRAFHGVRAGVLIVDALSLWALWGYGRTMRGGPLGAAAVAKRRASGLRRVGGRRRARIPAGLLLPLGRIL